MTGGEGKDRYLGIFLELKDFMRGKIQSSSQSYQNRYIVSLVVLCLNGVGETIVTEQVWS